MLLNEIIRVGGTTAITNELSADEICECRFISGVNAVSCRFVATDAGGAVTIFKRWSRYGDLREGWVDIATFASRSRQKSVMARPLHPHSRRRRRSAASSRQSAAIRVVQRGGLAYYSRMGFGPTSSRRRSAGARPRIQQVHKRYDLWSRREPGGARNSRNADGGCDGSSERRAGRRFTTHGPGRRLPRAVFNTPISPTTVLQDAHRIRGSEPLFAQTRLCSQISL